MASEKALLHIGLERVATVEGVALGKHYGYEGRLDYVLSVSDRLRLFKLKEDGTYTPIFIQSFGDIIPAIRL